MIAVQSPTRDDWWVRFDYMLDGQQQHVIYARGERGVLRSDVGDDHFLQMLDQRHAETLALGAVPILRKART